MADARTREQRTQRPQLPAGRDSPSEAGGKNRARLVYLVPSAFQQHIKVEPDEWCATVVALRWLDGEIYVQWDASFDVDRSGPSRVPPPGENFADPLFQARQRAAYIGRSGGPARILRGPSLRLPGAFGNDRLLVPAPAAIDPAGEQEKDEESAEAEALWAVAATAWSDVRSEVDKLEAKLRELSESLAKPEGE